MIYLEPFFVSYSSTFYLVPVRQIYRHFTNCENNRNHWESKVVTPVLVDSLLPSVVLSRLFDLMRLIFLFKLDGTQDNAISFPSPLRHRFTSWYQTASAEHYLQRIYHTQPESGTRFYTEI